jgi:3-phenylpropionate/trans-cinnamate dioxygenase ferredoxin reductase component
MLGAGAPYAPVPWFWSDQYDTKLQIAGLNTGYDRVSCAAGGWRAATGISPASGFLAVDAIDDPRAYMLGKRLLEMGRAHPRPGGAGRSGVDLKPLLR